LPDLLYKENPYNIKEDSRSNGGISMRQKQIQAELDVQPTIDPQQEIRSRVEFLKQYLLATHTKGYVLGISGGQDSSLAGRLAQLAVDEIRQETGKD